MLKGRTAVVTGSTSGIGLGIAEALAGAGADVMLNGFGDAGQIGRVRQELAERHGVRVAYSGADMSKPAEVRRMVEQAVEELGAVDILVNNAGIQHVARIDEFPDDKWDAVLAINLSAAFRATKAAVPGMRERRWGRIVNVASSSGKRPSLTNAAYSVAKAAQLSLSRVFAEAYAGTGVLVNAVAPGPVAGPLWLDEGGLADQAAAARGTTRESVLESQAAKVPIGRLLSVDEVAATIAFLCSEAASGVTGAAWSVDGGTVPGIT